MNTKRTKPDPVRRVVLAAVHSCTFGRVAAFPYAEAILRDAPPRGQVSRPINPDYKPALSKASRAYLVALFRAEGDRRLKVLKSISLVFAIDATQFWQNSKNSKLEAQWTEVHAEIHSKVQRFHDAAAKLYSQAANLYGDLEDSNNSSCCKLLAGQSWFEHGYWLCLAGDEAEGDDIRTHHNNARISFLNAAKIFREFRAFQQLAETQEQLGNVYCSLGQYEKASGAYQEAQRFFRSVPGCEHKSGELETAIY